MRVIFSRTRESRVFLVHREAVFSRSYGHPIRKTLRLQKFTTTVKKRKVTSPLAAMIEYVRQRGGADKTTLFARTSPPQINMAVGGEAIYRRLLGWVSNWSISLGITKNWSGGLKRGGANLFLIVVPSRGPVKQS